jgi:hypothetical protein
MMRPTAPLYLAWEHPTGPTMLELAGLVRVVVVSVAGIAGTCGRETWADPGIIRPPHPQGPSHSQSCHIEHHDSGLLALGRFVSPPPLSYNLPNARWASKGGGRFPVGVQQRCARGIRIMPRWIGQSAQGEPCLDGDVSIC